MEQLLKELHLNKTLEVSVCELIEKEKTNIDKLVEDCRVKGFSAKGELLRRFIPKKQACKNLQKNI